MISLIFSQANNIACAIYCKISLNIAVGYCRTKWDSVINDTEPNIFLLTDQVFVMAFIMIHLLDDALLNLLQQNISMQYSNNHNVFYCNNCNVLFQPFQ